MNIEGKSVYLQKFNVQHLNSSNYLSWLRDFNVMKYIGREEYLSSISFDAVEEYVNLLWKDKYVLFFAVHLKETNEFIGTSKINFINEIGLKTKTADIGIMIGDRNYWGKGLAKDILFTISNYCFDELKLRKLTSGAFKDNYAVIKAFESIGFKLEACLREKLFIQDKYYDQILMGCFKNEIFNDEIIK
jgi:ribosomal-protein-alanine N-acetyltransferase